MRRDYFLCEVRSGRQSCPSLRNLDWQHAASLIAQTEASTGAELPHLIKGEFDAFLECGIRAHGFRRLRCGECGHDSCWLSAASAEGSACHAVHVA